MSVGRNRKRPDELRSARWLVPNDVRSSGHRSRVMQMGYAPEEWQGRPLIAIINTISNTASTMFGAGFSWQADCPSSFRRCRCQKAW